MIEAGISGSGRPWLREEEVKEAEQEPEDDGSGDGSQHPGGATDEQHGVGEERDVGREAGGWIAALLSAGEEPGQARRTDRR